MNKWNERQKTLTAILFSIFFLAGMLFLSLLMSREGIAVNMENRHLPPSFAHLFGTDWLGRDMFTRTVSGLQISFAIGMTTAFFSTVLALVLSLLAAVNTWLDRMITWLIDLFLSVPHIVLVILISFAFGGGFKGVAIALILTHWPILTRLFRSEVIQIRSSVYPGISRRLGRSNVWIAWHHYVPQLMPQLFIGFLLTFPHAILHEAALTFLGLGLPAEQPTIGVILSESIQYLSAGMWWLAFFPGLSLLLMVGFFDVLGQNLRKWLDPYFESKGRI
jgi:peptide/nickel transport system permease protein